MSSCGRTGPAQAGPLGNELYEPRMRLNIFRRQPVVIVGLALSGLIVSWLALDLHGQTPHTLNSRAPHTSIPSVAAAEPARPGLPIRIKIPKIAIDALIDYVGLMPQGAMGVPKGPSTVAWFELGPRPGENGSAVMAGHFGWKNGLPAVFDNLHKLKTGDNIDVEDAQGTTTTFVVRELRTYDLKENTSAVFLSSDGQAHLNLVTCQGIWNKAKNSYSNRLVVFTDKVTLSDQVILGGTSIGRK